MLMAPTRQIRRRLFRQAAGASGALAMAAVAACGPLRGPTGTGDQAGRTRKPATLNVIYPPTSDADLQIFTGIFRNYEERQPGITINYDNAAIGHGDRLTEKLVTQVSGGTPPDVSLIHPSWATSLISRGFFLELSDRMRKDRDLRSDDILPYCLEFYQWQGKQYGLPYYSGPGIMFFNKSLFDRYGIKTPDKYEREGKWTWDTFLDVMKPLTRRELTPPVYGYERVDPGLQWYMSVPIWAHGGEVVTKDERESKLHEQAALDALQFQADLLRVHRVVPVGDEVAKIPNPGSRRLNSGQIGIMYGGRFYVPDFKGHANFDIGVVPVPKGPKGRGTRDGNNGFGVLKDAKQPDEGYTLTAFFTKFEAGGKPLIESGRSQPIRKSLYDDGSFRKLLQPWELAYQDGYLETAKIVRVWRIPRAGPQVLTMFNESWSSIVNGERTVKAAMEDLRPRLNELLRQAATG